MFLKPIILVKVEFLVVLCFLQVVFGVLNDLLDVLSEVSCIRHSTLVTYNDINRQTNLFQIHQFKWRATNALCHCRVDGKLNITQKITPF